MHLLAFATSAILVVGCGAPSEQSAPATPSASAESSAPSPAAAPPAVAQESATEAELTSQRECRGTELDLASLAAQGTCNLSRTADTDLEGFAVSLREPSLTARPGDPFQAEIVLENSTDKPLPLELDASCRFANVVWTELSRNNLPLDRMGTPCEPVIGCSGHVIGVQVDPGARAYLRIELDARAMVNTETCERLSGRDLAAGKYRLRFHTSLSSEPLAAVLRVRDK